MSAEQDFNSKFNDYQDEGIRKNALKWLKENLAKVKLLLEETPVSKFVLEPFNGVFSNKPEMLQADIYSIITKVAIINAVLAGLPAPVLSVVP